MPVKPLCDRTYRPNKKHHLLRCEKRQGHAGLHKAEGKFWRDNQ